jgi:hypothetical protein
MQESDHLQDLATLPGERAPGTSWFGGWVGSRAGLDAGAKRKNVPAGNRTTVVQYVA